jgi:hypothetical protein
MTSRRPALTLAACAFALAIPFVYAVARLIQARIAPEPDPALVVWSTRIGMYWRIAIGGYAGALVAPMAYAWARRDLDGATGALVVAVPVTALAIALQAVFVP